MADVFISFIHEEVGYAEAVKAFLTQLFDTEIEPFLSSDRFQIHAGERWLDRILGELKVTKIVLLILSKRSVEQPWVNFEAGAAIGRGIIAIPVCICGLHKGELPKPYSELQAVELNIFGDDEYLATSIAFHLGMKRPFVRMDEGTAALGGQGSEIKCKSATHAYDTLNEKILELNETDCG